MADPVFYPRFVRPRLIEALADTPVVLIHGPRQCGKSTLARQLADDQGYAFLSFDDDVLLAAAQADPVGFVFYWEHLGMLSVPSYREAWERKRQWYEDHGWLDRLITSEDRPDGGIDAAEIERIARERILGE